MRKTGKEIGQNAFQHKVKPDEVYEWLSTANAKELQEYLRSIPTHDSWAQHGRDTLNVVLANENIKLQTAGICQ